MEFESLEDVLKGYGIEMPEELRWF
jgi:hypothetical protein